MSWFVVDVEADGPAAGLYSMHEVGAVKVNGLATFHAKLRPMAGMKWQDEALAVCNVTHADTMQYPYAGDSMQDFNDWVIRVNDPGTRPIFVSDNLAFDWSFVNYYFHYWVGDNPFGWSGRRIGDIYAGLSGQASKPWKNKYRKTKHDHNPVNDAMGNAEALLAFRDELGFKVKY